MMSQISFMQIGVKCLKTTQDAYLNMSNLTKRGSRTRILFFCSFLWLFWNRALKACANDMGFDCDTYQSSIVCIWKKKKKAKANTVRETYFFKSSKSNLCLWEDSVSAKVLGLWLKDVCSLIRFAGQWNGFRISGRKENRFKTAEHKRRQ